MITAITNGRLLDCIGEDEIGSIEVSKWADIIVIDGHPDKDANLLSEPANVKLVMKQGEVFKNTL